MRKMQPFFERMSRGLAPSVRSVSFLVWCGCSASAITSSGNLDGSNLSPESRDTATVGDAGAQTCAPGTYVAERSADGYVSACTACPGGTFSHRANAERCTP
jgi:hypothetical protein